MGKLSVDLRDVVKDSMYRDSRCLSVQTIKEEASSFTIKYKEVPTPLQLSKSVNASSKVGMRGNNVPTDTKESLKALVKLRDSQWNYNGKDLPRSSCESKEGFPHLTQRDASRFSDIRSEVNHMIKDIPRLSLASRESSTRSFFMDSNPAIHSGNLNKAKDRCSGSVTNLSQPSTIQSRPSSVVAKLMGLDMLPDSKLSDIRHFGSVNTSHGGNGPYLAPLKVPEMCRSVRLPNSPRRREPTSPRWMYSDAVMKPVSSSKYPNEPAPWKLMDSGRVSPKQAARLVKSSASSFCSSPSVFGEMEKRLKDIEFNQSGKDLRALKQILEAMQAKGILEGHKEEQSSTFREKRYNDQGLISDVNEGLMNSYDSCCSGRAMGSKTTGSGSSRAFDSPIVIMKPAKLVLKSGSPASSATPIESLPAVQKPQSSEGPAQIKSFSSRKINKDQMNRDIHKDHEASSANRKPNNRNSRVAQTSSMSPQVPKDKTNSFLKSSRLISPRLQQKKLEFDKSSGPLTLPSNSSKTTRQPSRQSSGSSSPGGRRQLIKTTREIQNDDLSSEKSNDSRSLSCQEENTYSLSNFNLTMKSKLNAEISCIKPTVELTRCQIPSGEAIQLSTPYEAKEDVCLSLPKEDKMGDFSFGPEQPSPVSVLDSSVYMEDSPSPVKPSSYGLEGVSIADTSSLSEEMWTLMDDSSGNCPDIELPSEITRKKLQSIDNLVQKLRRLNSSHDEAQTDYIASLCENKNPDQRYISEILLASGLLLRGLCSGLTAFQVHSSGHPINPDLFIVLEQTKASSLLAKGENNPEEFEFRLKSNPEKSHRKLLFDTVNELLAEKLTFVGPHPEPWWKPDKRAKKTLNAQKLIQELCAEIELLQVKTQDCSIEEDDALKGILWEDVMHRSDNFTNFQVEVSSIVLDVERSIFKDLVDEIVRGNGARFEAKPNRRFRKLFWK